MEKFNDYLKNKAIEFDRSLYDDVTSSYMRAMFIHKATLIMLKYAELSNKPTTYLRRAKKILNDCGYYHLCELARKINMPKQTLSVISKNMPKEDVIILRGRKYIRWGAHGLKIK